MRKFLCYFLFFLCFFFFFETHSIGMGAKPTQPPSETPKPTSPATQQPKPEITEPTVEKPHQVLQQGSEAEKPEHAPLGQLPSEAPKEIKQPEPVQALPIEPEPKPEKEKSVQQKASRKSSGGSVSFNFDDADVFSVIQTIFGDVLRVNYIIDPNVKGRVNFRSVAPVSKDDVLPLMEVILRLNGIAVVEESGLYRIVPISDIAKEPAPVGIGRDAEQIQLRGEAMLQVIPVQYIISSELVKILTPFLSKNALIVDVSKGNYIIVVDTDANIKRLLQLVEIFDSEQLKQVTPQVFVYPVQNSKATDIASLLQQIFLGAKPTTTTPAKPSVTPRTPQRTAQPQQPQVSGEIEGGEAIVSETVRIYADETTNSIIILATPEDYAVIEETIKKIDIVPRQVMIEALIAEVKLSDDMSFGLAWSLKGNIDITGVKLFGQDQDDINLKTEMGQSPSSLGDATLAGSGFQFIATDPSGVVRARIEALANQAKVKVLASPHILVSDNREARIQIGDQVPIATSETNISGTAQIQRTIQYKDTGIIMKVKPQVNEGGLVSLELEQEVSNFSIQKIFDSDQVVISTRTATTSLVIQDGQTIVIGGLIREDESKSRSGLPFLSKIPILGYLFGSTTNTYTRTELVILLTPHVIRSQQEATSITTEYVDRLRKDIKMEKVIKDKLDKQEQAIIEPIQPEDSP